MSHNGQSSFARQLPTLQIKPQDQLYQISIIGSDYQEQNNEAKCRHQRYNRKQAKIVNKKSISQDKQSIVKWNDLCEANQKIQRPQKKQNKIKRNEQMTRNQPTPVNCMSGMYKIVLKGMKNECDSKFMSMAQLCHRYTFVHQHGSHSKYFDEHSSNQAKQQNRRPISYLKNVIEQDKYKTKYNFFHLNKRREEIKLPNVGKTKSIINNRENKSDYLEKVLNYLQKSSSNKKIEGRASKVEKQINEGDLKIEVGDCKQSKQKIKWKKSVRYNMKVNKNEQGLVWGSQNMKKVENRQSKKLMISMKSGCLELGKNSQKGSKRVSKSLQQCLILSKH